MKNRMVNLELLLYKRLRNFNVYFLNKAHYCFILYTAFYQRQHK